MLLAVETVGLCLVFWGICFLGTGTDEKNLRGLAAYSDEVQRMVREDPVLGPQIRETAPTVNFLSNLLLYGILLLVLCFFVREEGFLPNFRNVLIMGQVLNAFDLLVIDLLWWRHTKRVRFSGTEDRPELYRDPRNHVRSFVKGAAMFLTAALIDGLLLSLL